VEQTREPTNRNRIQGVVGQGERAKDREAVAAKEPLRGGSGAPLLPCQTTGHAGPHPAVQMVEVGRLSQAFPSAPCLESPIAPHQFAGPRGFTMPIAPSMTRD